MSNKTSIVCNTNCTVNCTSTEHFNIFPVCMYSIICVPGFIFNVLALVFFFRHTKSRSQTITYMTNLALADVLLILTLPMRIYYHLGYENLPQWLCDILGLVLKANMYCSVFLLTCICFDRCMAVTFPMSYCVQEWRKKAPLVCLAIWVLTFGASLPIYLTNRQKVAEKECFDNLPVYATNPVVVLSTLIVGFGIPLVVMLVCSCGLLRAVRQSPVAQTNLVDGKKIQRMIATSLFIFIISFLPYHIILVLLSLQGKNIPCLMLKAYRLSLIAACFNTVLDPIAYYFTTDTFRRNVDIGAVRRMFPLNSQSSDTINKNRTPNS